MFRWLRPPAILMSTRMCCANGCANYRPIHSRRFPVMGRLTGCARKWPSSHVERQNGFAEVTAAVIGLGGTGAHLLDLLVKSPVPKIQAASAVWV